MASCVPTPKEPSISTSVNQNRMSSAIAHNQLVRTIAQIGMSPSNINDIDKRLRLLKERPTGDHKLDRLHCVSVSPTDQGSQERFHVTADQQGRAERLLASGHSKATVFFVNQEEEFYNFYRESGPEKAFRVSVFFQMSNDTFHWLMSTVKPHPSFIIALDCPQGYYGSFITHDEDSQPRFLHLSFKVPHCGGLGASGYIRIDLKTDQTVAIFACHQKLETLPDTFTRHTGDSGLSNFVARFKDADSVTSGFIVALFILEEYLAALYGVRRYAWKKLVAMERMTGKGTLYKWFDTQQPDLDAFSTEDVKTVHRCVTEALSNRVAATFQLRLTEQFTSAHDQFCTLRNQLVPPDSAALLQQLAMKQTLIAHRARVDCLVENFEYTKERTQIQLDAVNTNINQATSNRAGTSASSMSFLAFVGTVFLPCGLIAQILDLGYFEIARPAVQLDSTVQSMVLIFILTILGTFMCCISYMAGMRFWYKWRRRNVSCLADTLA